MPKQDEEDHDHDAQGLDGPELGKFGDGDPSYLPGEHGTDERNVETQPEEGPQAGLVTDRQDAEGPDDEHPREQDGQAATHQGPPSGHRIEVGETDRPGSAVILRTHGRQLTPACSGIFWLHCTRR